MELSAHSGHKAQPLLPPEVLARLQQFQANLLSLISHELKTPLMGVLNALAMAESGNSLPDAIAMANRNAERLHRTLSTLLDLAAIDQSSFGVRLSEGLISKILPGVWESHKKKFTLRVDQEEPCLVDGKQFAKAIGLLCAVIPVEGSGTANIRITASDADVSCQLEFPVSPNAPEFRETWTQAWQAARVALEGGTTKSSSLFYSAAQSEEKFLSTGETGINSELVVFLEVMRLHHAQAEWQFHPSGALTITLRFPQLRGLEGLTRALSSRMHLGKQELSSLGLIWIEIPRPQFSESLLQTLKSALFRESDSIYRLDLEGARVPLALLANDCKQRDVPVLLKRLFQSLKPEIRQRILVGAAHFPEDAMDAELLIQKARKNVQSYAS